MVEPIFCCTTRAATLMAVLRSVAAACRIEHSCIAAVAAGAGADGGLSCLARPRKSSSPAASLSLLLLLLLL